MQHSTLWKVKPEVLPKILLLIDRPFASWARNRREPHVYVGERHIHALRAGLGVRREVVEERAPNTSATS